MKLPLIFMALMLLPIILIGGESVDQRENVQNYIKYSDFVVDICVYERELLPATPKFPKNRLVSRAVVTGVHKGDIRIGTKLEFYHLSDIRPKPVKGFKTVVEGELRTFFFSSDDGVLKDGKYTIEGDGHFGFERLKGDFAKAFQSELKVNPAFKK
ncbi:hypothetical protein HW115_19060 [Verrucomicrobiaceae bacterium N1E253]|uniref:Uncharacterized protein n=1 Tax=Oceaniferula marina TaxID=2748318 RepID=A0A851GK61_9BACT|nr:hypothetical protein [Oceaniferula marina]NWK57726.1 hypothetical protein [Oceaniferula marina]